MQNEADIGIIGLGVMGQNLALNIAEKGYRVAVFNRTESKTKEFIETCNTIDIIPTFSIKEFLSILKRPRKVLLIVKAGEVVDKYINDLSEDLEKEDIIIDAGNSFYLDSQRRYDFLKDKSIYFVGLGISGGEEGARKGPSLMPGGDKRAWPFLKEIFEKIAAKTQDNEICCEWIGEGGAGHFVKMVHNGIEYADMQIIAESYDLLKSLLHYSPPQLAEVYKQWNKGALKSYLIEITSKIFLKEYKEGGYLIEKILDRAKQKGTGQWIAVEALNNNVVLSTITEAVFARVLSDFKDERENASILLKGPERIFSKRDEEYFKEEIRQAVYAAKIVAYTQGFVLLQEISNKFNWSLDLSKIALIWQGGCIIRSVFLKKIAIAYKHDIKNLMLDEFFLHEILHCQAALRSVVTQAIISGIPLPCISSSLQYFDGYRSKNLPANLIQAQRDYFGAHTYEKEENTNKKFHMDWIGDTGEREV